MKKTANNQKPETTYEEAVAEGRKLNEEAAKAATTKRETLTVTTEAGGRWSVSGGLVIY